MQMKAIRNGLVAAGFVAVCGAAFGHGLVENPPARNWYCGVVTKPDHIPNGVAEYPECADAFAEDFNGGYQFMSVLTHAQGRSVVSPLPENVCGFDSESFNNGPTPWDTATDWPTSAISAGRREFMWDIQWGPHFDDTEEFKYWITKPGFQFDPNTELGWTDFEDTPFCSLNYDDTNPTANPDVVALKADAKFQTFCNVPTRSGRHIIYAEWGRNRFTYERFHGCLDVVFQAGDPVGPVASVELDPAGDFVGAGTITLDGSASQGGDLIYSWSVEAANNTLYTISDSDQAIASLQLAEPSAVQSVTVALQVSNSEGFNRASTSFSHQPMQASIWADLGPLVASAQTLEFGDRVSIRVVLANGNDVYYPAQPLVVGDLDRAADQWPQKLAQAVNAIPNTNVAIGLLGANDEVAPVNDATANRIYRINSSTVRSVFLQIESDLGMLFSDGFE